MSVRKHYINRLFGKTSFLSGLGSVFNIFGDYHTFDYSRFSREADKAALQSDREAIEQDFFNAVNTFRKKANIDANSSRTTYKRVFKRSK